MPKFKREMEIDAPIDKVWEVMTNPSYWPQWFPGVDSVSSVTSVTEGGGFEWVDDGKPGTARIVKMQPPKLLEILTQMGDDKDSHVFKLSQTGGFFGLNKDETRIVYTLDTLMGGGILGNFIAGGNPKDTLRVKKSMHLLRKLVESLY